MALYVVIAHPPNDAEVARAVEERCPDRQTVRPGVWLIRTAHKTSDEAVESLGIGRQMSALVVTARYIAGWFDSPVIERLDAWDEDTP